MKKLIFVLLFGVLALCGCAQETPTGDTPKTESGVQVYPPKGYQFSSLEEENITFLKNMGCTEEVAKRVAYNLKNNSDCGKLVSFSYDDKGFDNKNNWKYFIVDENGRNFSMYLTGDYLNDEDNNRTLFVDIM